MPSKKPDPRTVVDRMIRSLELPGPQAAYWTAAEAPPLPTTDEAEAIAELKAVGLTVTMIDSLRAMLKVGAGGNRVAADWPTNSQDQAVLATVAALSEGLAGLLSRASPRADAELCAAAAGALRDVLAPGRLAGELRLFGVAVQQRADQMEQSRQHARADIVAAVVHVAGHVLPKPTKSHESRFHRACVAAFRLSGLPSSPDKAIDAFKREAAKAGR